MNNILVVGSEGQLGSEIYSLKDEFPQFNYFFVSKNELDIIEKEQISKFVSLNSVNTIVNCAAYTNVEMAEENSSQADLVNYIGVKNLGEVSKENGISLWHLSTDYVFDGDSGKDYSENAIPNPINAYGVSKLKGEQVLLEIAPDNSVIIRTSWLYSSFGSNFCKTMLRLSKEKESITVVNDQFGTPTYAKDLAKCILENIVNTKHTGVKLYHFSNEGSCSWFGFAAEIMKISGSNCRVLPVASTAYKTKAVRPKRSVLNTSLIKKELGVSINDWQKSLKECLVEIKKHKKKV
ncbi:dTDP-4-dehydrorhamnose reductase [Flavicella sediminum]|uniref:dTDP-4-dehydrorhamnose reductase n=1 Tax=Flavicella sediminum TaxID=2585141 RepID=UPI00111EDB1F|nr:dTDP-4-dehydrorhamnose reductase [Flavicella sediminum]